MKYWTETRDDAFSYFPFFDKGVATTKLGYIPKLSIFSLEGSMLLFPKEIIFFKQECSKLMTETILEKDELREFTFYLIAIKEIEEYTQKNFNHLKLWKLLGQEYDIRNFELGPEIQFSRNEIPHYISVASFSGENFHKAFKMVSDSPQSYTIIGSTSDYYTTVDFTYRLLNDVIEENGRIDIFQLSLMLCPAGDLGFRWGSSSEEQGLDIIMSDEKKHLFDKVSFSS